MAKGISAPKGTYDILPEQQPLRRWLQDCAAEVFGRYGYSRLDTPLFEDTRLFVRGVGESTDIVRKEMYTFEDLGGRSLTLRPEGTAPAARAYVEHGMHTRPQPVKLWYLWPMFRYENPQSGRYRQHYQFGVEAFGSPASYLDAEVIGALDAFYREIRLDGLHLKMNSMGCKECRPAYGEKLKVFLLRNRDELCRECRERTGTNPLRVFDCKVPGCRNVLGEAPRLADALCPGCSQHHEEVMEGLQSQGIRFSLDHTLVRGMDYYTRTTFEFESDALGAQAGVGGGGRYDYLVESIGGRPTPGVGFGTGVERVILALEATRDDLPGVRGPCAYVVAAAPEARKAAFLLAYELRAAGVSADLDYMERSVKGQMKQAGRSGADYAVILGPEELAADTVRVKGLRTGEEKDVKRDRILEILVCEGKDSE